MPHFRTPVDHVAVSTIPLDVRLKPDGSHKTVLLEQWGFDLGREPHEIDSSSPGVLRVQNLKHDHKRLVTTFEIMPLAIGPAEVFARFAKDRIGVKGDPAKVVQQQGVENSARLSVKVGKVNNHTGMRVDLFAELLGRSEKVQRLMIYQRALLPRNNVVSDDRDDWNGQLADQPLKQNTNDGQWDCGKALRLFAEANFPAGHYSPFYGNHYYQTPKNDKMADLKMNPGLFERALKTIRALLDKKSAVRVFVLHDDGFTGPRIPESELTHFLTIIGHDGGDKFLYIDPWPGGSNLKYASGIFGDRDCAFMGILEVRNGRLESIPVRMNPDGTKVTSGDHDYVLIGGP